MKRFHRSERVSEEILKEASAIIQHEMKDPRLGMVSITRVELSQDLRHANIFFSVLGNDAQKEDSLEALRHGAGFVRSLIGKRLGLRIAPELHFKLDDSIERGIRINEILRKVLPNEGGER